MDQVRVVGIWGSADMGLGQHGTGRYGAWPKWGQADTGLMLATQSRKLENKSNKMRI